jgi:dTDP-4-dehydrorhamnose reductase
VTTETRPILLIGPSGQIGWELKQTLATLGPVHTLDRPALDLASAESIRRALRETAPGLIVNAGAYTAVDQAESEPDLAQAVNGTAPGILAEEAKRLGAALVHYSTDYVFDGRNTRPYREDDATGPVNAYGRSKLAGEQAIAAVGGAYLILRTAWVYSLRGNNFLTTIRRLAAEREELRVVDDQRGAPTWAGGIAEATALILTRCNAGSDPGELLEKRGLYHLTAAGETTWFGFAEAIVAEMHAAGEHVSAKGLTAIATADYPMPAQRPAWSVLDCGKTRDAFGVALPHWHDQLGLCLER